jgi:anthraniloyl-CoA monooxygenase
MKIVCVGGGPGGLYLALLVKKARPDWIVEVIERNRPDDTFGWGVVFSDETLAQFERADAPSYQAITASFAHWRDIEVLVNGTRIRSTGHGFAGLARVELLGILQRRCAELGVLLRFQEEVERVPEADLVVAADGVNSRLRAERADVFQPTLETGTSPFIWLGADRALPSFTFVFRTNEHGTWQVHAYPFDQGRSTFIVETDEPTLARAGLESAPVETTIAYLERLFAPELGGARLMANKSTWIRFRTVKNKTWRAGNMVLLGDAAHTAHFSIGSGTKLAMEDAIALAARLATDGDLAAYEEARAIDVAKLQRTARTSQEWFERAGLMVGAMDPLQLTASLLTRSRQITHANLKKRDPAFVEALDRWFAETAGVTIVDKKVPPPMFTPFRVRDLELANRVVVSPMCQYSAEDGMPNDWHLVHLGSRAVGGAGLVMAEMSDVSREGRITPGCAGLYDDAHVAAWRRIVEFVHRESAAKIGIQLGHAGRKASTRLPWAAGHDAELAAEERWPTLAPSALPYKPHWQPPREMTRADMERVLDEHVRAARRVHAAGFDLVEIHMAHGYLLASFFSPLSNRRSDAYGGDVAGRMRFPAEVVRAVREVWPKEKPLAVRLSATDWAPGGNTGDEAVAAARILVDAGCDLVDVSTGQTAPESRPEYGRMFQAPFSNLIRHAVGVPTISVGAIAGWDHVNTIIATGRADLCAMARPHLVDPYLTIHAAMEQGWDLRWPNQYLTAKPR